MGTVSSQTSQNMTQTGMHALRAKMNNAQNTTAKPQTQKTAPVISFDRLKKNIAGGALEEKTRKEKEAQLQMLLENALFLNSDEKRRKRWIESIPLLKDELLQNLLGAVIRESLRFKKGTRDLVSELNSKKNA